MSLRSQAWSQTPLPPNRGLGSKGSPSQNRSTTSKAVTPRVIPGEVVASTDSTSTPKSATVHGPRTVRSNVRGLFSNDRAESLPMIGWAVWGVWTQVHRMLAGTQAPMLYGFLMAASAALFVLFVSWKVKGPLMAMAAWGFVLMLWSLLAVAMPLTLGWVINLGVTWALILLVMYLPLLRAVLNVKYTPAPPPVIMQPGGLLGEPVDDFEGWSEMEGGRYDSHLSPTATGSVRLVQLPHGKSAVKIAAKTDEWANHLRCPVRNVEVIPDEDSADRVAVYVHTSDVHANPQPWPWAHLTQADLYAPIPFGLYRSGEVAHLDLRQAHVFLGGLPGGGKTVGLTLLTATAALDPLAELFLLDGKLSELQPWRDRASEYVGDDMRDAIAVLKHLEEELQRRNAALPDLRVNNVHDAPEGTFTKLVLVVDEMEAFTTSGDVGQNNEFCRRFQRLGKMGRSGGLTIVGTTQRPQKETFPPAMLATFGIRVAYRCADGSQTRLILGENATVDASRIPGGVGHQGKAYIGNDPRLIRGFFLGSEEAWQIAERLAPAPVVVPASPVVEPPRIGPRFPDGSSIPAGWQVSVWQELADRPAGVNDLIRDLGDMPSYKTVKGAIDGWAARGWLTAGRSGNATTWQRTDTKEHAA